MKIRYCNIVIALSMSLLLTGCITSQLMGDKFYKEKVSNYLFSRDEKYIVVLGERHHYIFDLPEEVKTILKSTYSNLIDARVPRFEISAEDCATASYTFILRKDTPENEKRMAMEAGFMPDKYRNGGLIKKGVLKGKRYEKGNLPQDTPLEKFNRTYEIVVNQKQGRGEKVAKTALTPLTATADGVLTLFGAPLFIGHVMIKGHE